MFFTVVDDSGLPATHYDTSKAALEAAVYPGDVVVEKYYHYAEDIRLVEDIKLESINGSSLDGALLSDTTLVKDEYDDEMEEEKPRFTVIESSTMSDLISNQVIEMKDACFKIEDHKSCFDHISFTTDNLCDAGNDASPDGISEFSSYPNIVLGYIDGIQSGKTVRLKVHKVNRSDKDIRNDKKKTITIAKKNEPVKCKECDIYFKKTEDLKAHMEAHLVKLQNSCPLCNIEFPSKPALQSHIRQHFTKSHACNICSERFATKSLLRSHKLHKHSFSSATTNSDVVENASSNNISVQSGNTAPIIRSVGTIRTVCTPAVVSSTSTLAVNSPSMVGAKVFKCSLCKTVFSCRSELKQHSTTHWQKPFKCEQCGATFTQNGSLQVHIRRHRGEKPFSCDLCGNSYTRAFSLKVHMKTHTGEKPHTCEYCSSSFITSSHLNVHRRIHTGERPFSCSECSATFITTSHLNVHKRIHLLTSPAPVRCLTCNISFRDNTQLRLHRKAYHQQTKKKKTNNHPTACRCKQCFKTTSSNSSRYGKVGTVGSQ